MEDYEKKKNGVFSQPIELKINGEEIVLKSYSELLVFLKKLVDDLYVLRTDIKRFGLKSEGNLRALSLKVRGLMNEANSCFQNLKLEQRAVDHFKERIEDLFEGGGAAYFDVFNGKVYSDLMEALKGKDKEKIARIIKAADSSISIGTKSKQGITNPNKESVTVAAENENHEVDFEEDNTRKVTQNLKKLSDDQVDTLKMLEANNSPAIHDLKEFQNTTKEQLQRFENNFDSVSNSIKELQSAVDQITPIHETVTEAAKKVEEGGSTFIRDFKNATDLITKKQKEATDAIIGLRNSEEERAKLKASTDFWVEKKKNHRNRSIIFSVVLIAWVFISIFCIIQPALELYTQNVRLAETIYDLVPYLPRNILLIVMVIWIAKVLLRQAISEKHLFTKAEEKKVLVDTYLLLIEKRKMVPGERDIMLESLFSPTQDGIVVDDPVASHVGNFVGVGGKS